MKFIQVWAQDMGGDSKKQVFKELDHSLDRIEREYDMMVKGLRCVIRILRCAVIHLKYVIMSAKYVVTPFWRDVRI